MFGVKRFFIYFIVLFFVLLEGYLIVSSIIDKEKEKNDIQQFCQIKCNYNPSSFAWEFSGETITKGFTTKNECFNYCSQVRQGFVVGVLNDVSNFLGSFLYKFKKPY